MSAQRNNDHLVPQWNNPRDIAERIYIQGSLHLDTPTHLGCGDADGLLDMSLMRDAYSGKFLLTGSTLAGALRGYLTSLGKPFAENAKILFGEVYAGDNKQAVESWLIVEDAIGAETGIEIRDGVAISATTGTAVDQAKYDFELLSEGTVFKIGFELLVPQNDPQNLKETLATALLGLEKGEVYLGKRKRRGFGRCKVTGWKVWSYKVNTTEGMLNWLKAWPLPEEKLVDTGIDSLLLSKKLEITKPTSSCTLMAEFSLDGPIIIRSNPNIKWDESKNQVEEAPDSVHLHSLRHNSSTPIVSGTSLAGVLRSRAVRICNVLKLNGEAKADSIFGNRKSDKAVEKDTKWTASRLWVEESEITGAIADDLVQTRVMIDRFTGGAHPGALFSEQPVFPTGKNKVKVDLHLQLQTNEGGSDYTGDIGLLFLLLKDLWAGDLPIGGESSVGRGYLKGHTATLTYGSDTWVFSRSEESPFVITGDLKKLNGFLEALERGE